MTLHMALTQTVSNKVSLHDHELFSRIVQIIKVEYEFIRPQFQVTCSFGKQAPSLLQFHRAYMYTNLSDLLPEVSDPVATVVNPAKSLETEGLSTLKILVSEASKWELIGVLLGIDDGTLKTIEADNSDSNKGLLEMVRIWLNTTDPPPTWKDHADALYAIKNCLRRY